MGVLAFAAAVLPAYGAIAGHTQAERADSSQLLQFEELTAFGILQVAGTRRLFDMARQANS